MWRRFFLILCLSLAVFSPVSAWDGPAHETACVRAWNEMGAPARAAVGELLDVATAESFARTCTWADDILPQRPETAAWHRMVIPKNTRAIDLARDCPQPASCLVDQVERQREIVASARRKTERAEALKFLSHLMADLHQPLHIAFAEDRGGADISITFLGQATNLHALWDGLLLKAPDPPSHGYTPFLKELTDRYNRERWSAGTPADWAQETLWVMRAPPTGYVGNPGGLVFDELYVRQNYLVATEQLERAGVRLALVLNRLFP
jgi:hypothetical protein